MLDGFCSIIVVIYNRFEEVLMFCQLARSAEVWRNVRLVPLRRVYVISKYFWIGCKARC